MRQFLLLLLLILPVLASADEISITRVGQYDWRCADQAGNTLSGHTRVDKAIQACVNRSLEDGQEYRVIPGEYRVQAEIGQQPPPEPPPEPPPDPPPDDQAVTFGPVQAITEYPSTISALAQDAFRWEITFTLNDTTGVQGLVSRDEYGTDDPGHLSVWVEGGVLTVRHQDVGQSQQIVASTPIQAGQEYQATLSVEAGVGMGLYLNGVLEAQDPFAVGTAGADLPLILGGRCSRCNDGTNGPDHEIDGTVYLEIVDQPLQLPAPVSFELKWNLPTQYVDDEPIAIGDLTAVTIYQIKPGNRLRVVTLGGAETGYEVTDKLPGVEYCWVATATANGLESNDSNSTCKEET